MMNQEDYNRLVSSLVTVLLEEGPKVAAEGDKEGATTPPVETLNFHSASEDKPEQENKGIVDKAKEHPLLAGTAVAGADQVMGLFQRLFGPHHFGSHAALEGRTRGTGQD